MENKTQQANEAVRGQKNQSLTRRCGISGSTRDLFIGQITGILTRQRIVGSTIFVDQASDLGYVYHHLSMSSEETIREKESFERYAKSYGVNI
jgi:hypothetical protein